MAQAHPNSSFAPPPAHNEQSLASAQLKSDFDIENISAAIQQEMQSATDSDPPFSVFTPADKRLIVLIVAFTTLLPPLTGSMYYPVIPMLAYDLNVSVNEINYTIMAYLV